MSPSDIRKTKRGLRIAGIVGAVVAIAIVATGVLARSRGDARLREWTEAQAIPTVAVAPPGASADGDELKLPGRLEAYARAPLYARTSGYLKSWSADIGTPVKAGQLLAEIETPDLDQQLQQARADLATAQANEKLAGITAERWQKILESNAVSKQDVDEKTGDLAAKRALVASAKANVDRYVALKGFTRIVAPFDGIVTARNTDVGALVNAGSAAGQELFVVSDTRKLRVYVNVPQTFVPDVPPGTKATLTVPEHPEKTYTATVEASAQAVNAQSGTTLMQLVVDNSAGELLPGAYANVSLALPHDATALSVPASALIFDAGGLRVATVGADNRVVMKPVTIARDFGKTIQLGSGLAPDDRVIINPPDGVVAGTEVRIAGNAEPAAPSAKG
ncbi:efflux RND transporter periplasmic adaptor subunit [Dokdonella fugitiva]|jgi:RND family efflux transporter MFP subunit|uniref:RND family efflux transporter MFP subunit n=1 Tax=Dokdonella fugitiva TaxID=328517 RepID=A0A4R2I428_9GAMM|nr:efflux RND transporter periplasmic adaptor subunit [Dokdonella fugitiva]TCO37235.1 RND family efflux transporter MFP subunit [Dokdonella fugitiva]